MRNRILILTVMLVAACSSGADGNRRVEIEPVQQRTQAPAAPPTIVSSNDGGLASEEVEAETRQNPFTRTTEDDLSTFAIDVDTGSYTIMRQWVESGTIPPPETVRPEEFVNFFDAGYTAPEAETFAVYADAGPTPWTDKPDDLVLRIGIKGHEVAERSRPDVNLSLVIDVSGSMQQDNRLELVKASLALLVDELGSRDTVSIVAYDTEAWVAMPLTSGDDTRRIMAAIDELEPGGSTNAEAGVLLGYEMAAEAFDREAVNRVILLSDGVANVGIDGPDGIVSQIDEQVEAGIGLLTIGVGLGNYNDYLMEQLADSADGNYRYIDDMVEAERVLVDELTGTLVTIAADVKIQVEFDRDRVNWYRLIGFENRDVADEDFRDDRVDGGEIGAGHSVTALYQLELAPEVRSDDRLAEVSVRWADPDRGNFDAVTGVITADVVSERWDDTAPGFRLATTAAAYAEVLRQGRYTDRYDISDVAEEADHLAAELDDPDVGELADLVARAARLTDPR